MPGSDTTRRLDRKLAQHRRGPLHPGRLRDRRRQGRRHGVRRHRGRAGCRAPAGAAGRAVPHPRRVPRRDARPGRAGRARHPAHLGLQRRAPRRGGVAGRRGDAGRAGQRHHRHLEPPRRQLRPRALAPVPHRRPRRRPAVLRPGALLGDVQQRPRPRPRHARGVRARSAGRPPALGMRHFLEVFNPNAPVGLARRARRRRSSTTRSCGRWPGVTAAQRPLFLKMAYNGAGRAGRARRARPVGGRRHPRRVGGHHPRHVRAAAPRRSGTAAGSPCSGARSSARSRSSTWSA